MKNQDERLLLDAAGVPIDPIGGVETEYGLGCDAIPEEDWDKEDADYVAAHHLTRVAMRLHYGQFDEDGRTYVDVGNHPEHSTAEDDCFLDVGYRVLKGHLKMADLYLRSQKYYNEHRMVFDEDGEEEYERPVIKETSLTANTCNTIGESWGSHTNLLAPRRLRMDDWIPPLIIHNLSRIVWSGAGRILEPLGNEGYRFALSEKAEHLYAEAGSNTIRMRPLVNTRDTPYADPLKYRRIHDISSDSVFSPHANALRLATTSIILRACGLNVNFDDLAVDEPLHAVRDISRDPTLRQTVKLVDRRNYRALDLQRAIAERSIEAAENAGCLTEQEKYWGEQWIKLCDDLFRDPDACADRVDWVIKKKLVAREVANRVPEENETPLLIAWQKAVDYHRLLPVEGAGMKLIRKGFFADSPSADVLKNDLPLKGRAALRAKAIRVLRAADEFYKLHWDTVALPDISTRNYKMYEPFSDTHEKLEAVLERIAA